MAMVSPGTAAGHWQIRAVPPPREETTLSSARRVDADSLSEKNAIDAPDTSRDRRAHHRRACGAVGRGESPARYTAPRTTSSTKFQAPQQPHRHFPFLI